jgi:hypothetical protein
MKRALLSFGALAVAFALPATAHGQTVNVSATVNPVITAGAIVPLAFGAADPGVTLDVSPLAAPAEGTRGELPLTHNTQFSVSATVNQLTDGTNTITGTYYCAYTATSGGTTPLDETTATTLCTALPQRTATTGTTYIMMGGNVPIPAGATAGSYSGSIVFVITPAS